VQVLQRQGLDLLEHRRAVQPSLLLQRLRVQPVAAGVGLELVRTADQLDEARRQLLRPPLVLGQRLQRIVEVPTTVRPATQVHKPMLLGNGCVRLVAVAHQHAAGPHALVQRPGRLRAAAGRVAEQPDRRPGAVRPAGFGPGNELEGLRRSGSARSAPAFDHLSVVRKRAWSKERNLERNFVSSRTDWAISAANASEASPPLSSSNVLSSF